MHGSEYSVLHGSPLESVQSTEVNVKNDEVKAVRRGDYETKRLSD